MILSRVTMGQGPFHLAKLQGVSNLPAFLGVYLLHRYLRYFLIKRLAQFVEAYQTGSKGLQLHL